MDWEVASEETYNPEWEVVSTTKTNEMDYSALPEAAPGIDMENLKGAGETVLSLATGATSWIPAGISMFRPDLSTIDERVKRAEEIQEKLAYEPRSETGRSLTETLTRPISWLAEKGEESGKWWDEKGYPLLGAISRFGGKAAPFLVPIGVSKGIKGLRAAKQAVNFKGIEEPLAPMGEVFTRRTLPPEETKPEIEKTTTEPSAIDVVNNMPTEQFVTAIKKADETILPRERVVSETKVGEWEVTKEEPITGIKNAQTLAERQERGLPEVEVIARRSFGGVFDEGKRLVDSGERDPRVLAQEMAKKARPLSPEESAILVYDRMRLKNEHKATMDAIEKAINEGDTLLEADGRARLARIEEDININDEAARRTGYEQGLGLAARRMMIQEDYSLASMIQRARIDNGGKPVPEQLRTKLETLSKQIEEANTKIAAHEEKISQLEYAKSIERIKREVAREKRQTKRAQAQQDLSAEFSGLIKELNETLGGKLHSGVDPAAALILGKMAKNRVKSGIITVEEVVDYIYTELQNNGIEWTKREIRDAISGYGVTRPLSRDEINVQLRELKRQMRLISSYEDAKSGKKPFRGGFEKEPKSEAVKELEFKVKEAMRESGLIAEKETSPEAYALKSFKTRAIKKISELERRLEAGDFSVKPKTTYELDKEGLDIRYKLHQTIRAYNEARFNYQQSQRNVAQKVGSGVVEAVNLSRAIKTSFDLSAVLRQGGFIAFAHPIRAAKSIPDMFRALTKKGEFAVNQEILNRPNYRLYEQGKLYLSEHGQKLSQMEEVYMSRWADKVPGVAASQRAYTTFLNKLRADSFDVMVDGLTRTGQATPKELAAIANYINVATGRGNFGMKQNALVGLNTAFFAPRYVASRFQLLAGQPLYKGTARTRAMVAKEYARFLVGIGTVYTLAYSMGAEIEIDPRSSDFGKIRFGNTRIDPLLGLSQTTTLIGRLIAGETKTGAGKIVPIRGEKVPYGGANSADVMARFLRSKLSPVVGTTVDVLTGQDVVGQPVTPGSIPEKLLMPLAFNDIYETMKEQGVPATTAFAILSIFGMGLQNYDIKEGVKPSLIDELMDNIPTKRKRGYRNTRASARTF